MRTTIGAVLAAMAMATTSVACGGAATSDPDPLPSDYGTDDQARSDDLTTEAPGTLGTVETGTTSDDAAPTPPPSAPSTPVNTAPAPDKITVSIDGVTMTLDGHSLWAPNAVNPEEYDLFVKFHGTGALTGTDIALSAYRTGAGCKSGENFITYRPKGDAQYMPAGALGGKSDATCGLSVSSLPLDVGDRFKGTFDGTLTSINVSPAKTKKVRITFDVARTK